MHLKEKYTFHFSNFLLTGLCNSSANCWFGINSLLIAPPEDFLPKYLWTVYASPHWYPLFFGFFAILDVLSRNSLPEAVLLGKSLNSP